jgi:hypothetical protein
VLDINEPERLEMRAELHSGGDSLPERRVRRWGMVNALEALDSICIFESGPRFAAVLSTK